MNIVNKFLGVAIRGDYLSYSLIFKDSLYNLGSIELKTKSSDYFSKFNSVLSVIKSDVLNEECVDEDSNYKNTWSVGIYHDPVPNKHNLDLNKFYKLCKMNTIVECSCSLTLSVLPIMVNDSEMCKAIAKLSNSKISNIDDVVKFATNKLSNFINSPSNLQFNSLATSWATALTLKRRAALESLVLDDKDTVKIQNRLMGDKIVNELIQSINNKKDDKEELKNVLKKRVHKLVEDYVEGIV